MGVAHRHPFFFGDVTTKLGHRRRGSIQIRADQIAPFLGIELRGNRGRADQIAEHDCEIAAFARGLCNGRCTWRRSRLPRECGCR
jgi:hypothetical protein